jgi:integrase
MDSKPVVTADNYTRLLPRPGRDRDRFKDTGRGAVPGLTLIVTAAGARRWVYLYKQRATRKKVFLHLGDAADTTLAQARVKAREQRSLRDHGQDPRDERRQADADRRQRAQEAERIEGETLVAAVTAFIAAKREEWSPSTVRERERMARVYLPKMPSCTRSVSTVRPFEVEGDLAALAPIMGNRVRSLLLASSRWAVRKERLSRDIVSATDRPTRREVKRERVLAHDEVVSLWLGHDQNASVDGAAAIPAPIHVYARLLLLCGTRRGETATADWSDITLDGSPMWVIPAERRKGRKDGKRDHHVPLSAPAVALLRTLNPRENGRVFPAMIAACPGRVMTTIRTALAIEKDSPRDWSLHDLRRTFATGIQALGVPQPVITAALGQTPAIREPGVATATDIYTRHAYMDERRDALKAWGRHVLAMAKAATRKRR